LVAFENQFAEGSRTKRLGGADKCKVGKLRLCKKGRRGWNENGGKPASKSLMAGLRERVGRGIVESGEVVREAVSIEGIVGLCSVM
jgi:hypothetical protein